MRCISKVQNNHFIQGQARCSKCKRFISAKPRDAAATAPLTVSWEHSVIFYSFILFLILILILRSHQAFTPKWVQHFQSLGASVCLLQIFWKQLSSAKKSTEYKGFPRKDSGTGCLLLPASVLHHIMHFVRMFPNKHLSGLLPFVSIQPAIQCMPWRHELHRFCELKIPVNGKLLQH